MQGSLFDLLLNDLARADEVLEVFAGEIVVFEFFEGVDREAICTRADNFPDSFQETAPHEGILLQEPPTPW